MCLILKYIKTDFVTMGATKCPLREKTRARPRLSLSPDEGRPPAATSENTAAGGRRQAAGGRRQAAGGRRQAAGGRRQASTKVKYRKWRTAQRLTFGCCVCSAQSLKGVGGDVIILEEAAYCDPGHASPS